MGDHDTRYSRFTTLFLPGAKFSHVRGDCHRLVCYGDRTSCCHVFSPTSRGLQPKDYPLGPHCDHNELLHPPYSGDDPLFGSNLQDPQRFITPFNIYERIQLAGFFVQESIISLLYIVEAIRVLRPILAIRGPTERQVVRHLILVNIVIVVMDVTLLVTQYTNNFEIQTTYKTAVYSIKLKMEFEILNRLLCVIQGQHCLQNLPIEIFPPPRMDPLMIRPISE